MPRQVWLCSKCNHPFSAEKSAEDCEKSHISVLSRKFSVVECYEDMSELPNLIKITNKLGEVFQFYRTENDGRNKLYGRE
jgi:hypothetical protein